jgi:hypothetical protein
MCRSQLFDISHLQNREHLKISSPRLPFKARVMGTEMDLSAISIETLQVKSRFTRPTYTIKYHCNTIVTRL